ncbi:MAG: hypothetical protein AABY22_05920 [Nanoarchaeota archaeon]
MQRLTLVLEFPEDPLVETVTSYLREFSKTLGTDGWKVSLTRDGDRSGANLFAPIEGRFGTHYKNTKVPLSEVI